MCVVRPFLVSTYTFLSVSLLGDPQYVFNGDGCVPSIVVSCMDEDTPTDHPHHPTIASARIRTPHPSYT